MQFTVIMLRIGLFLTMFAGVVLGVAGVQAKVGSEKAPKGKKAAEVAVFFGAGSASHCSAFRDS